MQKFSCKSIEAAQAKEVEEAGERNPTFREAEMSRFACLQAKLWLLWDGPLPRENSRIEILFV